MQQSSFIWYWPGAAPTPRSPLAPPHAAVRAPTHSALFIGNACLTAASLPEVSPARSLVLGIPLHTACAWGLLQLVMGGRPPHHLGRFVKCMFLGPASHSVGICVFPKAPHVLGGAH